jgi:hypothetical protein
MNLRSQPDKKSSSIPTYQEYLINRRSYLQKLAKVAGALALGGVGVFAAEPNREKPHPPGEIKPPNLWPKKDSSPKVIPADTTHDVRKKIGKMLPPKPVEKAVSTDTVAHRLQPPGEPPRPIFPVRNDSVPPKKDVPANCTSGVNTPDSLRNPKQPVKMERIRPGGIKRPPQPLQIPKAVRGDSEHTQKNVDRSAADTGKVDIRKAKK